MFAFHRHLGAKASLIREDKNCIFEKSESLTVHFTFASALIYCSYVLSIVMGVLFLNGCWERSIEYMTLS